MNRNAVVVIGVGRGGVGGDNGALVSPHISFVSNALSEAGWSSLVARRPHNPEVIETVGNAVKVSSGSYEPLAPAERCQIQLLGLFA